MKDAVIKFLRWMAVPLVYLAVSIIGFLLGKIIFNYFFADTGLFLFDNPKVHTAVADITRLLSQMLGTCLAMHGAGAIAPSHKIGTARTAGVIHAVLYSLCGILVLLTSDISLSDAAGILGVILGAVIGWFTVEEVFLY